VTATEQYRSVLDQALADLRELGVPESEARPILARLVLAIGLTVSDTLEELYAGWRHG
jgi:hypothetical protein